MDEDPEALVERRLARDPEDARELVLQRARPVGLDVRGAEQQPVAARGQEGLQRGLLAGGDGGRAGARVVLGVEQHLVERAGLQDLALLGGGRAEQRGVDPRQGVGHRLARGAVDERGELDQLEVAHGAVGDVEVGVQAQLAQAPGGARDRAQQLVAQRGEGRVQRLVGAEELLGALLPRRLRARRAPPRGRARGAAARRRPSARRSRGRAPRARVSSRRRCSRRMSSTCSARVSAASSSCSSASGIGSARRRRAPGMRADCRPRTKTWRNSRPCAACIAMTQTAPWRPSPAPSSSSCRPASATAAT